MKNSIKTRTEKDSLGTVQVPLDAYFGSYGTRAKHNFKISNLRISPSFFTALGIVKLAAVKANHELRLISEKNYKAIFSACKEFISGKFNKEMDLDVFQAGAGTSYNMTSNEIIANRANEILKSKKGEYKFINPNDHVNMAQSTNDVIPTATRIATLMELPGLLNSIKLLEKEISKKAVAHKNLIKVGRTHLQDAVSIKFGQEFDSYKEAFKKSREFLESQSKDLKILGIGGTAVGTGINTHKRYKELAVKNINVLTGIKFESAKNLTETTNNMNSFMNFSATLRSLATNLLNFCNDLKIMNMGPKAGINEITLSEVQPGSSIMPGKVNPSIPESVEMVCLQVLGNDKTIELAAQKSSFEINVFCPIIAYNLLQSMEILTSAINTLSELAIKNLTVNTKKIREAYEKSLCTATALSPILGYKLTAEIVKAALKKDISIKDEILERKLLTLKELQSFN